MQASTSRGGSFCTFLSGVFSSEPLIPTAVPVFLTAFNGFVFSNTSPEKAEVRFGPKVNTYSCSLLSSFPHNKAFSLPHRHLASGESGTQAPPRNLGRDHSRQHIRQIHSCVFQSLAGMDRGQDKITLRIPVALSHHLLQLL